VLKYVADKKIKFLPYQPAEDYSDQYIDFYNQLF